MMNITRTEAAGPLSFLNKKEDVGVTNSLEDKSIPAHVGDISPAAQSMREAVENMANSLDVDMDKVNQVRAALDNNTYQIDIDSLAEAILGSHRK